MLHTESPISCVESNQYKIQIENENENENVDPRLPHSGSLEPHPEPAQEPLFITNTAGKEYQENKRTEPSIWKLVSSIFIWEVLAMVLSIVLLLAIVVILTRHNHHPQPTWRYFSLNSMISWLSTISKGCVLFSISEVLGQLKWVWFSQKKRPMSDLRTFDAASRGLYGSAGLIWKLRARHFAVPGSLAVILALAFDPFTQNLIHYYPKLVADASETAIVSNNSVYDVVGLKWITGGMTYMDQGLKASIYNAIFNNDEAKPWAIPQYTCTSGNCTWNPITALEIAASCANITDHLKYKCTVIPTFYKGMNYGEESNCSVYLPDEDSNEPADGLFAEFVTNTREGTAVAVGSGGKGVFFEDPFIVPIHLIAADNMLDIKLFTTQTRWQAMECTTSPIVRSFRPAVTRGVYNEETLGVWTNRSINHDFSSGYYLRPPWGIEMGMERNTSFMVGYQSIEMLLNFFVELFAGHANLRAHSGILFAPHEKAIYASTDLVQAVSYFNITGCTVKTAERLRCVMENVALAMSKTFRDNPSVSSPLPYTEGQALTNITYVSVHWQWIILPALVCLLGLTTLLGTIWKTRKAMVPTWKNDAIPLLFLYEITQDEKPENYQKPANNQRMMLKESEGKMLLSD